MELLGDIEVKTTEDLLPPGAEPGTMPTDENQSTGLERLEILGKMQGVDVFDMRPLDASRKGTSSDFSVLVFRVDRTKAYTKRATKENHEMGQISRRDLSAAVTTTPADIRQNPFHKYLCASSQQAHSTTPSPSNPPATSSSPVAPATPSTRTGPSGCAWIASAPSSAAQNAAPSTKCNTSARQMMSMDMDMDTTMGLGSRSMMFTGMATRI